MLPITDRSSILHPSAALATGKGTRVPYVVAAVIAIENSRTEKLYFSVLLRKLSMDRLY